MLPDWLPWLLQTGDSQFPSGSYAHSQGLEEFVRCGVVRTPEDLETFLHSQVLPSLYAFELRVLARAHRLAAGEDAAGLAALDHELDAWKMAAELRAASRQIGARRLVLMRKLGADSFLDAYAAMNSPQHQLVIAAAEMRHAPAGVALCAFAMQSVSGYCVAAMKLIRMGQERSHVILRGAVQALTTEIPRLAGEAEDVRAGWFNPLLEIASMRHARARERLFIS